MTTLMTYWIEAVRSCFERGGAPSCQQGQQTKYLERTTYCRAYTGALHDVHNVVHHDVHAAELRPGLDAHAQHDALEHALGDQGLVAADGLRPLKLEGLFDLLVLGQDLWVGGIAVVEAGQYVQGLFPPVLGGQPPRAVGQEKEADKEDDGREHLHAPRDAEGRCGLVGIAGTTADLGAGVCGQ